MYRALKEHEKTREKIDWPYQNTKFETYGMDKNEQR
jgi:hypothetical protein